jgi:hypothetical protein
VHVTYLDYAKSSECQNAVAEMIAHTNQIQEILLGKIFVRPYTYLEQIQAALPPHSDSVKKREIANAAAPKNPI